MYPTNTNGEYWQTKIQEQRFHTLTEAAWAQEELKLECRTYVHATNYLSASTEVEHQQSKSKNKQGLFECKCISMKLGRTVRHGLWKNLFNFGVDLDNGVTFFNIVRFVRHFYNFSQRIFHGFGWKIRRIQGIEIYKYCWASGKGMCYSGFSVFFHCGVACSDRICMFYSLQPHLSLSL